MSVPLHKHSLPIEDLLVMILLVTNKGKEQHYARVVGRGPTQQLDQVRRSPLRLQASASTMACLKPVLNIFSKWVPATIEGSAQVSTELTFEVYIL